MIRAKACADAICHFLSGEQPSGFDDIALGMNPVRLNPVEPGTLTGQGAGNDAHAVALVSDLSIVCPEPGAHRLTDVSGCVVPDHEQRGLAHLFQLLAASGQVLRGDWA